MGWKIIKTIPKHKALHGKVWSAEFTFLMSICCKKEKKKEKTGKKSCFVPYTVDNQMSFLQFKKSLTYP